MTAGGSGIHPTRRVVSPYTKGLGSLRGVSGGAVGAGFVAAIDGAATGYVAEQDSLQRVRRPSSQYLRKM